MTDNIEEVLSSMITNRGNNLRDLSLRQPVMLIFLRHFGCTFCRTALAEISEKRKDIEAMGSRLVFVHMADNIVADSYFNRYNLDGAEHISDPTCQRYAEFGLFRGKFKQLFGLSTWIKGFQRGVMEGHSIGQRLGDDFQMPGVFVLRDDQIMEQYIHKLASDNPDYVKLAECCVI